MTLIDSETIQKMFDAYNSTTGFGVPFNMAWERVLFDCARMGLTPEMIVLVIKDRRKGIERGDRKPACLMPRNLFYGEDIVNEVIVEAHALMALKRRIIDPARISVMKASGRPSDFVGVEAGKEIKQADTAKASAGVVEKLLQEFKQAAL